MTYLRVAGIAAAISVSMLLGCSSSDTVVAANVQSSNDNQNNPTTDNGRKGGLLDPGIEDGILNHASANPTAIRIAVKIRLTVSQNGQTPVVHLTVPALNSWTVNKLDSDGNPLMDDGGKTVTETHKGIGAYYDRLILPDGWKEGEATLQADALDSAGMIVLSATVNFSVVDNGAVYVPIDLKIPDARGLNDGGTASDGGDSGEAGDGSAAGDAGDTGDGSAAGDAGDGSQTSLPDASTGG